MRNPVVVFRRVAAFLVLFMVGAAMLAALAEWTRPPHLR